MTEEGYVCWDGIGQQLYTMIDELAVSCRLHRTVMSIGTEWVNVAGKVQLGWAVTISLGRDFVGRGPTPQEACAKAREKFLDS